MSTQSIGTLYIVSTPIGNLEDITLRAIRVLQEVDFILCEDTRHTKHLLDTYKITTSTKSFHAHSDTAKIKSVLQALEEGKQIALVSDAGTPLVSDPGSLLLMEIRKAFGSDVRIVPIPGASALTAAISVVPIPEGRFTFFGFLPHKKGRQTLMMKMCETRESYVMYESTHRILKLLDEFIEYYNDAQVFLCRELTKEFEEVLSGTPIELKNILIEKPEKQRGEFVVVVTAS